MNSIERWPFPGDLADTYPGTKVYYRGMGLSLCYEVPITSKIRVTVWANTNELEWTAAIHPVDVHRSNKGLPHVYAGFGDTSLVEHVSALEIIAFIEETKKQYRDA
jgi:hypothetical protein